MSARRIKDRWSFLPQNSTQVIRTLLSSASVAIGTASNNGRRMYEPVGFSCPRFRLSDTGFRSAFSMVNGVHRSWMGGNHCAVIACIDPHLLVSACTIAEPHFRENPTVGLVVVK